MLDTILITVLIVAICIALLSIGIFLKGKFPNTHVRVTEAQLSNGKNFLNFTLDSRAENIEFVLSNGTGADVVVKNIEVK